MPQLNASLEMKKNLKQLQSLLNPKATVLGFKKIWDRNFFQNSDFVEIDSYSIQQIEQIFEKTGYVSKQQASDVISAIDTIVSIIKDRDAANQNSELSQSMGMSSWKVNTGSIQLQIDDLTSEISTKNAIIEELQMEILRLRDSKVSTPKPKTPQILGKIQPRPNQMTKDIQQNQQITINQMTKDITQNPHITKDIVQKQQITKDFIRNPQMTKDIICNPRGTILERMGELSSENEKLNYIFATRPHMYESITSDNCDLAQSMKVLANQSQVHLISKIIQDRPRNVSEKQELFQGISVSQRLLKIMKNDIADEFIIVILKGRPGF